jgi:hypothetical protein
MTASLKRGLKAFGHFWLDFLIGDTPELFFAALLIVGLSFALRDHRMIAIFVLPIVASVLLVASVLRGRVKSVPIRDEEPSGRGQPDEEG